MGRNATDIIEPETAFAVDLTKLDALGDKGNELVSLQAGFNQAVADAHDSLGQAKMAMAMETFSRTVRISKFAATKENKAYKHIIFPHGAELPNTWEGYCKLLGHSVDQVDRDIANLHAFGEEALESMLRIGIGYRDLGKFRKLPDDEKVLLIEAAKAGDKDSLVEFAETLISKHTKEREALVNQVSDLKANVVAAEDVSKGKQKKINELTRNVEKFSLDKDWPAQTSAAIDTMNKYAAESERFLGVVMQACTQAMEAAPNDEAGQQVWAQGAAALAARVRDVMARQKEVIAAADSHFLMTLNQYLED